MLLQRAQLARCATALHAHGSGLRAGAATLACEHRRHIFGGGRRRGWDSASSTRSSFADTQVLGFSPEQMFDVVADVAKYSQFVPFCSDSRVIRRLDGEDFEAELAIQFFKVVERYTSRVTVSRPFHIHAAAIESDLFTHLASDWKFKPGPAPGTCVLDFSIDFAVSSPLYQPIIEHVLPEVTAQQVGAFKSRCATLYGAPQPVSEHPQQPA